MKVVPRLYRRVAVLLVLGALATVVVSTAQDAGAAGVVSGTVYRDSNNNGVRDTGEDGVGGIVISGGGTWVLTSPTGTWSMTATGQISVRVTTGWYRSQCNQLSCPAGPGSAQDFAVNNQMIVATVNADTNPVIDAGIVPDWPGGYPIPLARPVPANAVDVSSRVSFIAPTGGPGTNCFRTTLASNRACAIGDQPKFLAQVFNEGTTAIANPTGYLALPVGTSFVSMAPATAPANHPSVGTVTLGAFDPATRRLPFALNGTLPAGGAAMYTVSLLITPDAPITTTFQTRGSYPNPIGIRITNVPGDAEGDTCAAAATNCRYGQTNKQASPDNSDTVGFAIVPAAATTPPVIPPPTTVPTQTVPGQTVPGQTVPATTVPPATTAPSTTTPRTTVPATTVPATTVPATTAPPTTSPTRPPPVEGGGGTCKVSSLLVPSCGAWLGASTAAQSGALGSADYVIGLDQYEAVAGNTPDILHFYKSGAAKFPNQTEISMANRPGKQRSLLFYNWKPSPGGSWRDVANGSADSAIATVATSLKAFNQAYNQKVFLTIFHEPENDVGAAGRSEADYVAMYRYVVTKLRSLGVTNAVFVMNYMGFNGWSSMVDALWPGEDVVDWIAYDPYGFKAHTDFGHFLNTPKSSWPGFYSWATAKAPGKPIMLAEWGFDLNVAPNAPEILDGAVPIIQRDFPMLKALVYWNDDNGGFAVRLDQSTSLGQRYGQAYRRLANDPYFNATATAVAP